MNIFSHPMTIYTRDILRKIGVLNLIQTSFLYKMANKGYESRFDHAMQKNIALGDCVFDIGANVGYYSSQFSDWVGSNGMVFAFEPIPESANRIRGIAKSKSNINVHQLAIGSNTSTAEMTLNNDPTSPNNRIVDQLGIGDKTITVKVDSVDNLIESGFLFPNCIKIDVEGFEWEVFQGLSKTLRNQNLKHVFVEVHFRILSQRGLQDASSKIYSLLESSGFKLNWIDFSHLHAFR